MPRRQINLSFTEEAFEQVTAAADAQGVTINQFSRAAIMDAAEPLPEDLEEGVGGFPAWVIALLSLLRRTPKLKPRWDAHMAEVKWRQQAVL